MRDQPLLKPARQGKVEWLDDYEDATAHKVVPVLLSRQQFFLDQLVTDSSNFQGWFGLIANVCALSSARWARAGHYAQSAAVNVCQRLGVFSCKHGQFVNVQRSFVIAQHASSSWLNSSLPSNVFDVNSPASIRS